MNSLELNSVSKIYKQKGKSVQALKDIAFSSCAGAIHGLLGENGSGKTTLIKILLGLISPSSGNLDIKGSIGAVLEGNRNVYWRLSPMENIEYFLSLRGISVRENSSYIDHLLDRLGLNDLKHRSCSDLSLGQKRRVAIACALSHNPDVLLLDEPTNGLDLESSEILYEILREQSEKGKTILISSHDLRFIEKVCKELLILRKGSILYQGSIVDFKSTYSNNNTIKIKGAEQALQKITREYPESEYSANDHVLTLPIQGSCFRQFAKIMSEFHVDIKSIETKENDLTDIYRLLTEGLNRC